MKKISLVVPMYNEEKVIPLFFSAIEKVIANLPQYQFELVVVNDGSRDATLTLLRNQQKKTPFLVVVNLSRNFGHEPAVAAGIKVASGDALIPMDADLQDPPELIVELLKQFEAGYEVVNAKRQSRHEDSFFKRFSAITFYRWIAKLSGKITIPQNVGHFRLISRRVADEVIRLSERNRVFRIEVPFVGFKTTEVKFDRPKRAAGQSHYNFKSMLKLAIDAITSTTSMPLIWPTYFFFFTMAGFTLSSLGQIMVYFFNLLPLEMHGYWFLSNLILGLFSGLFFLMAVVALYISRVYIETQNRPFYIIDEIFHHQS
jgi:polyisoprenyl-phosphate glycosyltransferase